MLSGQKVSSEKTGILFSLNVPRSVRHLLVKTSGFRVTFTLSKYFGVPLLRRDPRPADYQYIIRQVQAKLDTWKLDNFLLLEG
jgi:hypothetical protein